MALGSCPDCKGPLSTTAKFCPKCGYDAEGARREDAYRRAEDARRRSMTLITPKKTYTPPACSCDSKRSCSCDGHCSDCMWNGWQIE